MTTINSRQLIQNAFLRQPTPRIPVMPQICYDLAIQIEAVEKHFDWRAAYRDCAENPKLTYDYVLKLAERTGCDGVRLFALPDSLKAHFDGNDVIVLDPKTNNRIGKLDLHGGGDFIPDQQTKPIGSLQDAKIRLQNLVNDLTDTKLQLLAEYRQKAQHLFVATAPGGITMNTYCDLRGREQAMIDFYERPDFVSAVMDMQADAIIERSEKLIKTGVDAFYIGDPAASASLIHPKHFEQFCLPAYQKFCRHFRDRILIYIHICGNSSPLLEMLAETGAHTIEPLDPLGPVEVWDAKKRVGKKVALMGGVNTLTMCDKSANEVTAEAIQKCKEGGPTGYILAAGDMVPANSPIENLQALVDVARYSLWKST
ncbi:MAG: methylcobalamin:coenzyme M methyltransferase [Planctomycetes bacterium ADurb.Bin401]|nr:MAG: methylcobalamin:coenzyme M methyltransferase [Planctomycetes bacterium ADurb.Bin401]